MSGIKEVIEKFYSKFKRVTLRLTYNNNGNEFAENYNIDRVCEELLEMPWHPKRMFDKNDIERFSGEQREVYVLKQMDEFDKYIPFEKAEFNKLPHFTAWFFGKDPAIDANIHKKRNALRPMFNEHFPRIIVNCGISRYDPELGCVYKPTGALKVYRMAMDNIPRILEVEDKKKQLGELKSYVLNATDWGEWRPIPVYIEAIRKKETKL